MRDHQPEIEKRGANLVVIGTGAPPFIAAFRKHVMFTGPILSDPERKAYDAAGFTRSLCATFSVRALGALARALKKGFTQGRT